MTRHMVEFRADFRSVYSARFDSADWGSAHDLTPQRTGTQLKIVVEADDGRVLTIGVTQGPPSTGSALTGLYATPSPTVLCIVARGDGYLLDIGNPDRLDQLPDSPLIGVVAAPEHQVLVLATPWHLVGLARHGIAWRSPRIAIDGIERLELHGPVVSGVADPDEERGKRFTIDVRTGLGEGGNLARFG